jgi:ribonuclease G
VSKELVISSTPHETRVAIVDDDRLSEIYVERATEHAIAGGIYKGRVNRVLPGMQSAFVKIGLERDAFLYVTDIVDETEQVESGERDDHDEILLDPQTPPAEKAAPAQPSTDDQDPSAGSADSADGDKRRRRGRRSRRRKGRGASGLPEAKFAELDKEPAAESTEEAVEDDDDSSPESFALLPGESLAKYEAAPAQEDDEEAVGWLEESEEEADSDDETPDAESVEEDEEEETDVLESPESDESEDSSDLDAASVESAEPTEDDAAGADSDDSGGEEDGQSESGGSAEQDDESKPPSTEAAVRDRGDAQPLHRGRRGRRRRGKGGSTREDEAEQAPVESAPKSVPAPREEPRPELEDSGIRISDLLKAGQEIIVQVAKEPLGKKGARITSHVALPGRFVVYMPTVAHTGISRKIGSEAERNRLRRIIKENGEGFPGGFIVRTAGQGAEEADLIADVTFLANLWKGIKEKAERRSAPALLHADLDIVERILRDHLGLGYKTIWVDSEDEYERVLRFVERFQPDLLDRVKLYTREAPIFDKFNITQELERALKPKVWLKSGGYLVINQTEALVAIDVNTGKYVGKSDRLEDTIVKTNLEAAEEVVRQMRLRDLGGIIVIDFIDMDDRSNRKQVALALEAAMRSDRAPSKTLAFNDFGLVAITRKRVKQSLERVLCSPCPACQGSGHVQSVPTVIYSLLGEARRIGKKQDPERGVVLRCNPDVAKELKSRSNSYLQELEEFFGASVIVKSDVTLARENFDID